MKVNNLRLLIACLTITAILLITASCAFPSSEATATTSQTLITSVQTQPPSSVAVVLPPDKLTRWEKEGIYIADTLEEAELVAGYEVVTLSYIPDGFKRTGSINVSRLGAGLPENLRPKFTAIIVDQTWVWQDNKLPGILFSQQNHQYGIGNSEPTVIAGKTYERSFSPAEGDKPARLTLGWSDGTLWYTLLGDLKEHLDEATLIKIAESVGDKNKTTRISEETMTSVVDGKAIVIQPGPGNIINNSQGVSSGVLLNDIKITTGVAEKDYSAGKKPIIAGETILVLDGTVQNEHPTNTHLALWAKGFNKVGEQVCWTLDAAHILGQIGLQLEKGQTGQFEIHLNQSEDVYLIQLYANNYSIAPP